MSSDDDRDHVTLFRGAADNSYFEVYFNAAPLPGADAVEMDTLEVDLRRDRDVIAATWDARRSRSGPNRRRSRRPRTCTC